MQRVACEHCANRKGRAFDQKITMAFQPIFSHRTGEVFAQEALLRGTDGRGAGALLSLVDDENMYHFDQTCRTTAIEVASRLDYRGRLSINFMPNAIYEPRTCIQRTLWAAELHDFPIENIIFEFTETEKVRDTDRLKSIVAAYKDIGFKVAIDDFGAGWAGLGLMADVLPDIIKIDRHLITDIDTCSTRQAMVRSITTMCTELGVQLVGEGVETEAEYDTLVGIGIDLIQGYFLARPQFEALQSTPANRKAA